MNTSYTLQITQIEEQVVPGKRLGRHVRHDSRSLAYRYATPDPTKPLTTILLKRSIPILNQGDVGACTEFAGTGALGTGPLWVGLARAQRSGMNDKTAFKMYSEEQVALGYGPYPPNDNGGDGLTACKVMQANGYISGYTHCLALSDVLEAVSDGNPTMIGSNWYNSFDTPTSSGLVSIAPGANVRGAHEYLCRGIDVEAQLVFCDNSWGEGWGDKGSFTYSWDTLEALLAQSGDGTVPAARVAVVTL